jgi:RNA polymerase sigma-54 factor
MAFETKLGQELRLRQQLVMTPQLQQAIKILQLPVLELEAMIQSEVEQNPILEIAERGPEESLNNGTVTEGASLLATDQSAEAPPLDSAGRNGESVGEMAETQPAASDPRESASELRELDRLDRIDWSDYLENYSNNWSGTSYTEEQEERRLTLEEHLMWQLRLSDLSEAQRRIGESIIYNLNDDGYLMSSVEELAAQLGCEAAQIEDMLARIQRFDPAGVASRDLQECLLNQLRIYGMEDSLAARIIRKHLSLLEKHRYTEIARLESVSPDMVNQAIRVISLLEPKPGRDYGDPKPVYVVPDVLIRKQGDDYIVTLNEDALPRLRLSSYYQRVLRDHQAGEETRKYLQERLRSARWLVKSIYQRQQTIYRVASSIVRFQRDFFERGIAYLKPLVLRDIANDINMHESTISRATANKYADTPQGIFELKFFFTSSVKAASGEEVSAETIKERIRQLVASESHGEPLSDQAIVEILRREQINIARRTVAKYRQALSILPSAKRRRPD